MRRTGRWVETYDISVAANHNFFADGVLVHNCQHDAASSCAHLHNVIRPRWILGLTATPFRMDRVKLCFDAVVKDAGIHQLIQDGYLSRFDHYTIPKWEVSQLADFYCAEPNRWGNSIFYFHSIEECRAINAMLRERGIVSDVITGSTDRERQLAAYRAGGLQVLINCMVLSEGFDDPTLQTVWVRPSGKGPTIQMAGRVLRRCGDAIKQVIQCRQTRHPFAKTATPQQSYLWQSGQWRSLTMNPKLNLCNQNVRLAIAGTVVSTVMVGGEPTKPTNRFWMSLYARYGFNKSVFEYFEHAEVFRRIAQVESRDRIRLCIERDEQTGESRLLAASNPAKAVLHPDELLETLSRYEGENVRYSDGVIESTHAPRLGGNIFEVGGDTFRNRFVVYVPVDGYGLPSIYLSLLRQVCSNGMVGYSPTFRSALALGRGEDNAIYSIIRALDGFGSDEGYAALRQRFEAAAKSWASVYEAQSLYRLLVKMLNHGGIRRQAVVGGTPLADAEEVSRFPQRKVRKRMANETMG